MSTATIAQLVVEMTANTARFTTDIQSATRATEGAMRQMTEAASIAKSALAGLAAGFSAGAVIAWAKDVVNSAAALDDFAEATGSTVENLSKLTNQAKVAGVSADTLQTAITKLAAGMNGADDESTKVGKALAQLGIQARDPAEAFREIAVRMDQYADGTGKAAFLADVFGKNWAAVLPVLRAVVEEQDVAATVTAQHAAEAERLTKEIERLSVQSSILKTTLLSDLVPAIARMAEGFRIARAEGLGFWDALDIGGTYADRLAPKIAQTGRTIEELQKKIAGGQKYGFDSWVEDWMKELKTAEAELRTLTKIRDGLISRNVSAMGWTGDARDLAAGNFGGKPSLDYKSQADGAKEAKVAIADYAAEIQKLQDEMLKLAGPGGGYDHLLKANEQYQKDLRDGKIISIEQVREMMRLAVAADEQKQAVDANAAAWKSYEAAVKMAMDQEKAADDARYHANLSIKQQNDYLQLEHDTLGMTATQQAIYVAHTKLADAVTREDANAIALLNTQLGLLNQRLRDEASMAWAQQFQALLLDVSRGLSDFFVDLVNNGSSAFKNLWNNFKNWALRALADIAAKQVVVSVVGALGIGGTAGAAAANGIGGSGDLMGTIGTGSSIYNAGSALFGGVGSAAALGYSAAAAGYGAAGGQTVGMMMAAGAGDFTAVGAGGLAAGIEGGLAAGLAAIPVAGWIALGALIIAGIAMSMDKGPAMRTGDWKSSTGSSLGTGNPLFQGSSAFGSFGVVNDKWFSDSDMGDQFKAFLTSITSIDNALSTFVGKDHSATISTALANSAESFQAGMEHEGVTFGDIMVSRYRTALNALSDGLGKFLNGFDGTAQELATFVLALAAMDKALKDSAGMMATFGETFDVAAVQAMQQNGEKVTDTFQRLTDVFTATNLVAESLGKTSLEAFGAVGLAGYDARKALVDLAGGVDILTARANFYFQNFLTPAQQLASTSTLVNRAFGDLNMAVPATIEGFNAIVNGLKMNTEEGRNTYNTLMAIAPAWLAVHNAASDAAAAALQLANAMGEATLSYRQALAKFGGASDLTVANLGLTSAINAMVRNVPGVTSFAQALTLTDAQLAKLTPEQIGYITAVINSASAVNAAAEAQRQYNAQLWQTYQQATAQFRPPETMASAQASLAIATASMSAATGLHTLGEVLGLSEQQWLGFTDKQRASILTFLTAAGAVQKFTDAAKESAKAISESLITAFYDLVTMLDPVSAAIASIGSDWEKMGAQGAQLQAMLTVYDGSAAATQRLSQATRDYYNAVVSVIAQIERLKVSIKDMFDSNIQTFTMSGMNNQQKYDYIQKQTAGLVQQLTTATDPALISKLSTQIATNQMTAWNLLTPQQQAAAQDLFIKGANDVAELARQRTVAAEKEAKEKWDAMVKDVKDAMMDAAKKMDGAGDKQGGAADLMLLAASALSNPKITVKIDDPKVGAVGSY